MDRVTSETQVRWAEEFVLVFDWGTHENRISAVEGLDVLENALAQASEGWIEPQSDRLNVSMDLLCLIESILSSPECVRFATRDARRADRIILSLARLYGTLRNLDFNAEVGTNDLLSTVAKIGKSAISPLEKIQDTLSEEDLVLAFPIPGEDFSIYPEWALRDFVIDAFSAIGLKAITPLVRFLESGLAGQRNVALEVFSNEDNPISLDVRLKILKRIASSEPSNEIAGLIGKRIQQLELHPTPNAELIERRLEIVDARKILLGVLSGRLTADSDPGLEEHLCGAVELLEALQPGYLVDSIQKWSTTESGRDLVLRFISPDFPGRTTRQ